MAKIYHLRQAQEDLSLQKLVPIARRLGRCVQNYGGFHGVLAYAGSCHKTRHDPQFVLPKLPGEGRNPQPFPLLLRNLSILMFIVALQDVSSQHLPDSKEHANTLELLHSRVCSSSQFYRSSLFSSHLERYHLNRIDK